jgi:hypothetical protein
LQCVAKNLATTIVAGMKGHRSAVRFEVVIPGDKMELLRAVARQAGLSVNAIIRLAINRLLVDGEVRLPVGGPANPIAPR